MTRRHVERRSHARFPTSLEVEGKSPSDAVVARMVATDLSLGGLYCVSSVNYPEMTRLAVRLVLPGEQSGNGEPLDLDAVVVRHRPIASVTGSERYELALYFASMSDPKRERLARFLSGS